MSELQLKLQKHINICCKISKKRKTLLEGNFDLNDKF